MDMKVEVGMTGECRRQRSGRTGKPTMVEATARTKMPHEDFRMDPVFPPYRIEHIFVQARVLARHAVSPVADDDDPRLGC